MIDQDDERRKFWIGCIVSLLIGAFGGVTIGRGCVPAPPAAVELVEELLEQPE